MERDSCVLTEIGDWYYCQWKPCYSWQRCDMSSHKYIRHVSRWYECTANVIDQIPGLVGFLAKFLIEHIRFVSFLILYLSGVWDSLSQRCDCSHGGTGSDFVFITHTVGSLRCSRDAEALIGCTCLTGSGENHTSEGSSMCPCRRLGLEQARNRRSDSCGECHV